MTNEQIQEFKAAAENLATAEERYDRAEITIREYISVNDQYHNFVKDHANILSLLAERDADKALIAESVVLFETLRQRIAELEIIRASAEKLVRCKGRYHSEQNYRALAALFGVSAPDLPPLDSEARTVTVKLPPVSFFDFKLSSRFASGAYVNVEAMNKELAAVGITLVVGE